MNIDLHKLKALAIAAKSNPYDAVAGNDYGMAMPPAVTLELIAEIERHRPLNAEGCKPEINIQPSGSLTAAPTPEHDLDKAEGEQPDLNLATSQLAELAAKKVIESGAANYIGDVFTISLNTGDQPFEVIVTTQRVGAKTPHELHVEAAAERDTFNLQVAERGSLLEHWLQLANSRDDNLSDLAKETRALLDSETPSWQQAARDVLTERRRQIFKGYTAAHDDHYSLGELTCYAVAHALIATGTAPGWVYQAGICQWQVKIEDPRTMLITAAALLLAELERLDRAAESAGIQAELLRLRQMMMDVTND